MASLYYDMPDSLLLFNSEQCFSPSPQAWIKHITILQQCFCLGELYFYFPLWNMPFFELPWWPFSLERKSSASYVSQLCFVLGGDSEAHKESVSMKQLNYRSSESIICSLYALYIRVFLNWKTFTFGWTKLFFRHLCVWPDSPISAVW